jgi:hypothetical protein
MKTCRCLIALLSVQLWCPASWASEPRVMTVSRVLKSPTQYAGKTILVAGRVFADRHHKLLLLDSPSDPRGIVLFFSDAAKETRDFDRFISAVAHEAGRAGARGVFGTFSGTVLLRKSEVLLSATSVSLPSR